ncbi:MAG: mechanosensitive ion channel [Alphaproteobacteria bacterium]|nr:mechanosensitive ion channel [Alphaproteobacteria bacterium]
MNESFTFNGTLDALIHTSIQYGIKLLVAVLILFVGLWLSNRVTNSFRKIMEARHLDPSLMSFFTSFVGIALKVMVFIIVLTTVGVQMTSIIAILGAASLAVGMALSGTLQNFAGGIVILLFKPFVVGEVIQTASGRTGTVEKIMIFTTELHTGDKQIVYLPNGALSNGEIINLSRQPHRRADIVINIAYGDSVEVARAATLEILAADKRVLANPAPSIFVKNLSNNSIELTVRYWTKFGDYYSTQADTLEKIYNEFPSRGLRFPFPQLDVRVENKGK